MVSLISVIFLDTPYFVLYSVAFYVNIYKHISLKCSLQYIIWEKPQKLYKIQIGENQNMKY